MTSTEPNKPLTDKLRSLFENPRKKIYLHFAVVGFMVLIACFRDLSYPVLQSAIIKGVIVVLLLLLFYCNVYWLVPKYLFKNRWKEYSISVVVCIILMYVTISYMFEKVHPYHLDDDVDDQGELSLPFFSFMIMVLVGASAAFKLFQQWLSDTKLINELEKSKTVAELEQLKNQINPHFLFNMLNNANVLTKKDPDKASAVLMGLSDLLRYQLYDSARENVLLTSDIHFLRDFLSLEKIRRDDFDFIISKEGELNGVLIPPLLFITFVENAVKHNNDSQKASFVHLYFEVNDNILLFKCINSKPAVKALRHPVGGLGLANVQRRLNLLYPLGHELVINDEENLYSVTLKINL